MDIYDLVFIVKDENDNALKNVQKSIFELNGEITSQDKWGGKNFYFPIKKHTSGFYLQWNVKLEKKAVVGLKKKLEYDENVLRYLLQLK